MSALFLPILVLVIVVLLVLAASQLMNSNDGEARKLRNRLSSERTQDQQGIDPIAFTVVRHEMKIDGISGQLAKISLFQGIAKHLGQIWPRFSLAKFLTLSATLAIVALVVVSLVMDSMLIGVAAALAFCFMPLLVLNNRYGAQQKEFMEQLPQGMDFLSRILRAGHSLSTGLQMMADELPDPLSGVFRRCYDQHSVGQSMDDSLKDAAVRVDNPDFGFFVTSILIQRQTGGDLSEVLDNISDMIRQRIRLQQHVKAKTAEGRFTGYVLVVFPIVLFFICYYLNPQYPRMLLHTHEGQGLLCLAGGLLVLGLLAIRKITTIKV